MLSKGMLASEEVQANVGTKLEQAIEDLRVKYAKIEAEKAAADAAAAAAAAAEAEKAAAKEAENDWSLARDDPELEARGCLIAAFLIERDILLRFSIIARLLPLTRRLALQH